MSSHFPNFLEISLQASLMGTLIWLILKSPLAKFCSAKALLLLWSVLLIRFLIPWNVQITTSLISEQQTANETSNGISTFHFEMPDFEGFFAENFKTETEHRSTAQKSDFNILRYIPYIWILGIAGVGLVYLTQFTLFHRTLHKNQSSSDLDILDLYKNVREMMGIRRDIPLIQMNDIGSAAIIGILRPKIVISKKLIDSCDKNQLKTVLVHELTHYKQGHLLINSIGLLVCALHWFNPLSWFFYRKLRHAIELACDEAAVASVITRSPESYAHHLVDLVNLVSARPPLSLGLLGLYNNLKSKFIQTRILMIRENSTYKLPATLVLSIGLLGICMGSTHFVPEKKSVATSLPSEITKGLSGSNQSKKHLSPTRNRELDIETTTEQLSNIKISELHVNVDAFATQPEFSTEAKIYIKEELLGIIKAHEYQKALPLMLKSPFSNETQMLFQMGNTYLQLNKVKEAKRAYINAFNSVPFPEALKNLILIYMSTEDYSVAGPLIEKYIELANKCDFVTVTGQDYLMAGSCAMKHEDYELAEIRHIEALALNGNNNKARRNLFQIYLITKQYRKAESHIKILISQTEDPDELSNYYKYYANVAVVLEDRELAIEMLEKNIQFSPKNEQAVEMLKNRKQNDNIELALKSLNEMNTLISDLIIYDLSEVTVPPKPTKQVAPIYPTELKEKKTNGSVIIVFVVDVNGAVIAPRIEKSTDMRFEESALAAIKQWEFSPAKIDGKAVKVRVRAPLIYKIK